MRFSMHAALERLRRDEEGQTLVLAALAGLVLALCIMATVNVGSAVYEKIRVQNAADNVAYSEAAMEARAMNFFAYANRAQVVQYAAIMTFTAFLSYVLDQWAWISPILSLAQYIPYVGFVFKIILRILKIAVSILDVVISLVIPLLSALNVGYFLIETAMEIGMGLRLASGPPLHEIRDNDPLAQAPPGAPMLQAYNALAFANSLQMPLALKDMLPWSGGGLFRSGRAPTYAEAARLTMNEVANDARNPWVVNSTSYGFFVWPLHRQWHWHFSIPFPVGIPPIATFDWGSYARTEVGTYKNTSLLSEAGFRPRGAVFRDQDYSADVNHLEIDVPILAWQVKLQMNLQVEVWADLMGGNLTNGTHRGFSSFGSFSNGEQLNRSLPICNVSDNCPCCSLFCLIGCPCKAPAAAAELLLNTVVCKPVSMWVRKNWKHTSFPKFFLGITPYMVFNPSPYVTPGKRDRRITDYPLPLPGNFSQPDVLEALSVPASATQNHTFATAFSGLNHAKLNFVTQTGKSVPLLTMQGFNAWSAAQVYYHRPGDWREQPNLFNPFWGAKLVPIAETQAFRAAGLLGKVGLTVNRAISAALIH